MEVSDDDVVLIATKNARYLGNLGNNCFTDRGRYIHFLYSCRRARLTDTYGSAKNTNENADLESSKGFPLLLHRVHGRRDML